MPRFKVELLAQFHMRSSYQRTAMREIVNSGHLPAKNDDIEHQVALAIQDNIEAEDELLKHFLFN